MGRIKTRILNYLLKHLFNGVTDNDFVQIRYTDVKRGKGVIIIGERTLTPEQTISFVQEARSIRLQALYPILIKSMRWSANDSIFNKSNNLDDIIFGKACLYVIDVLDKKLEHIAQIQESGSS